MITGENYVNKLVFEMIGEVSKASKKADKLTVIDKYREDWAFKSIIRGTYDDKIEWLIPAGEPPYTPSKEESSPSNLKKRYKDFAHFIKNKANANVPAFKREKIFLSLIESIHPEDAKLVIGMINKQPIKGITKALITEAFPELFA